MVLYIALLIFLLLVLYRLNKWVSRRCRCGSYRYSRCHKIHDEGDGCYTTYTFRKCSCGSFTLLKSDTKVFNAFELWWRETFFAHQFLGLDECLSQAGLTPRQTVPRKKRIGVKIHPVLGSTRRNVHRGRFSLLKDRWK